MITTEPNVHPGDLRPKLSLLQGFQLTHRCKVVPVARASQRVVAFVALHERAVLRAHISGALWLDVSDERASANLRSALWRTPTLGGRALIGASKTHLWLDPEVQVDFQEMVASAAAVIADGSGEQVKEMDTSALGYDLLPDWYEDWVLIERERFRQLRLHALESICEHLTELGRYGQAIQAGLAAVAAEPLRESAHRTVIQAHLKEGNWAEAIRQYRAYARLLDDELGLRPSPAMERLMNGLGTGDRGVTAAR